VQSRPEVPVSLAGLDLCEVHFQVLKKHGAHCLYPRVWLRAFIYIVLCTYNRPSTYLGTQGGELGNEIVFVQQFSPSALVACFVVLPEGLL
jgi:hypothetical protein